MNALDDSISIQTPEGVKLSAVLADPISRGWALFIDIVVMLLLAFGIVFLFALLPGYGAASGIFQVLMFVLVWGYFFLFEWLANGMTPGKGMMKIRVVGVDLMPVTVTQAAWRNVLRYLDFLPALFGVGMIAVLVSSKNQRLGDWMAGTVVVFRQTPMSLQSKIKIGEAEPPPWKLSRDEQRTLIAFAAYAQNHHIDRLIELSEPLADKMSAYDGKERVEKLLMWARWLNGGQGQRDEGESK